MQNNVTDLSQKLQRSLDNNYNVVDMPAVIEIISTLEKTAVTKELLETTRLGKSINELRRRTSNESLAKRAKELLKKWRDLILPNANGQVKPASNSSSNNIVSSSCPAGAGGDRSNSPDTGQLLLKSRKRPARTPDHPHNASMPPTKRPVSSLNGQSRELDFSDNSNCSIKEFSSSRKTDVIFINSDSNSSMPDHHSLDSHSNDTLDIVDSSTAVPKKRGRKKGSKNHKNLIIAAEESFTNKMSAVSRNSKVKTTQELLADLQNRTVVAKQDIELRAAQLTESLSRIDQKLNPQKQINKNVTPMRNERSVGATTPVTRASATAAAAAEHGKSIATPLGKTSNVEQHWSHRSTPEVVVLQSDDEIVDVVGTDPPHHVHIKDESCSTAVNELQVKPEPRNPSAPLTISGLLAQLPPVDVSIVEQPDEVPPCTCPLPPVQELPPADKITVQIVDGDSKPADSSIFCPPSPLAFGTPPSPVSSGVTIDAPPPPPPPPLPPPLVDDEVDEESVPCAARSFLRQRYDLDAVSEEKVASLHGRCLPSVNGNVGLLCPKVEGKSPASGEKLAGGLYVNIVPNLTMERLRKDLSLRKSCAASENYKKYSISNSSCPGAGGDTEPTSSSSSSGSSSNSSTLQQQQQQRRQRRSSVVVMDEYGDVMCRTASAVNNTDTASTVVSEPVLLADASGDPASTSNAADDDTDSAAAAAATVAAVAASVCDDGHQFREWHETLDVVSYNGETLRILPYVIID